MQYRKDRKGNDISLLGFGCMRFEGSGTGEYFQKANDQVMEDRKSTRLNSSHMPKSRMPSSA